MNNKNDITNNKNPLISICVTFFNSGRYIHRALESCLNQAYKNIEVVVVDDASTDNSEAVLREYAARDSRVSYYRNNKRIGLAESELQMFKFAKGEFSMMMGADDWLARDYIKNGVRSLLEHPDAAGVIPKMTSLLEVSNNKFKFLNNTFEAFIPPGIYSTKWFIKRMYRPIHLFISTFALVRTKDYISAMDYYVKNYYYNPSKSTPEELKKFFKMAFGMDVAIFPEILTRYKNFVFDSSLNYIKIAFWNGQANHFDFNKNSLSEIFREAYYFLLLYTYIYKFKWEKFYSGMKIFLGAETLSTVFIYFFRRGMHFSFLNFSESKNNIRGFFNDFSLFEIVISVMYSIPMVAYRCLSFLMRKLIRRKKYEIKESLIFNQEKFLDMDGHFKVK